jgi:hypothetical protein
VPMGVFQMLVRAKGHRSGSRVSGGVPASGALTDPGEIVGGEARARDDDPAPRTATAPVNPTTRQAVVLRMRSASLDDSPAFPVCLGRA